MNREDRKELIEDHIWVRSEAYSALESLYEAIGNNPEGPIQGVVYRLLSNSNSLTARIIGDTGEWLRWFIEDNNIGNSELEAGYDDNMKPIKTVDDLLDLMEEADKK